VGTLEHTPEKIPENFHLIYQSESVCSLRNISQWLRGFGRLLQ